MRLYIVRHAVAEERRPGLAEADRALTPAGRRKFEACVAGMKRMGVSFEAVLHSPLKRAMETARMLAPLADGELVETPLLAAVPGPELIQRLADEECAAVVGHQPWLGQLVSLLVNGEAGEREQYDLRKGGMAILEGQMAAGSMVLRGLYTSRDLRQMATSRELSD